MDKPQDDRILVAVDRLRRCPDELGEGCWPPAKPRKQKKRKAEKQKGDGDQHGTEELSPESGPPGKAGKWSGRLRNHLVLPSAEDG